MATTSAGTNARHGCAIRLILGGLAAVFALLVLAIPFACIAYGAYEAVAQDRDLRTARPVVATVVSSRVGESRGRRGRRKSVPVVVFRYEVGGLTYQSDRTMLYASRGLPDRTSAEQFVAAHPPGATVEAYYVPREPWRASLLKRYNEAPYGLICIGLGVLAIFQSALGLGYAFYSAAAAPTPRKPGWLPLKVRRPLRARVTVNGVQAAVYLSVWGWTTWHYLARVPGPHGVFGHVVPFAVGLPGLWYLFAAGRAHLTRRAVSDARVAVRAEGLCVGGRVDVRVEQDLLEDTSPERVRVGLVCERTTGSGKRKHTEVCWQTWATPDAIASAAGPRDGTGRRLAFTQALSVPADQPASTPSGDPCYAWKLVVETALAGCPDYREVFDLHVAPA